MKPATKATFGAPVRAGPAANAGARKRPSVAAAVKAEPRVSNSRSRSPARGPAQRARTPARHVPFPVKREPGVPSVALDALELDLDADVSTKPNKRGPKVEMNVADCLRDETGGSLGRTTGPALNLVATRSRSVQGELQGLGGWRVGNACFGSLESPLTTAHLGALLPS